MTKMRLIVGAIVLAMLSPAVHASFFQGDTLDSVAKWLALFIIFVLPIGGIYLFWMIHILPEKVAEKRHHPQKDAIKTLCLLSLLFGGLLWPFAWLWAYTKPVDLQDGLRDGKTFGLLSGSGRKSDEAGNDTGRNPRGCAKNSTNWQRRANSPRNSGRCASN